MKLKEHQIKYAKQIPLLYGYSPLHILENGKVAIVTTAKQGSTYLRNLSVLLKDCNKHSISPQEIVESNILNMSPDMRVPSKLDLKNMTEFFNGKSSIEKVLFLYRDPLRKMTGGLWQDFMNSFSPEEGHHSMLDVILSKIFKCDMDTHGFREAISYLEGRRPGWKNPYSVNIEQIELFTKDIFRTYIKQIIQNGSVLSEGHTRPWCADALVWEKEFSEMGYITKFFDLDNPNHNLSETLKQTYKIKMPQSKIDRASNVNVRQWVYEDKFDNGITKSLRGILEHEFRAYDLIRVHPNNITKAK